ncbi:hypothetical protein, partial [Enterococcus faecium]
RKEKGGEKVSLGAWSQEVGEQKRGHFLWFLVLGGRGGGVGGRREKKGVLVEKRKTTFFFFFGEGGGRGKEGRGKSGVASPP